MAEVLKDVSAKDEIVNGTMSKNVNSTEGMIVAYTSIVIMALIPIVIGSFRSTRLFTVDGTKKKTEKLSSKDALAFPFIASGFLFTLYMIFKTYLKEYLNLILSCYFLVLGVFSVTTLLGQFLAQLCPACIPVSKFSIVLRHELSARKNERNFTFNLFDVISFLICSGLGYWYFIHKHWIANNIFGMAFAIYGVELLQLSSFFTGFVLLAGLFFYDIFWVFGTDVMVSVAKSFEAPIKLLFPQNIFVDGISGTNFAMLGLGDIVIPGIFIALLLRFDYSLQRNRKTYFYWTFMAYFSGLLTTIGVMHYFKHAQPALLYLVPACVLTPLLVAAANGDIKQLFSYDESEKNDESAAAASELEEPPQSQAVTATETVDEEVKKQN